MAFLRLVAEWFVDPANWSGNDGIPVRLGEHLYYCVVSTAVASAIALPLGLWLGHTGRGGQLAINVANVGRAIPAFGIVLIMVVWRGLGVAPVIIALIALAIPPILTNTYVGIRAVDPEVREAAEGMGLRGREVLTAVELPIALPLIMAGVRTSAVQVVATATIGAFGGLGGLGRYLIDGLAQRRVHEVVAGALIVAGLALLVESGLGAVQRLVVSRGLQGAAADAPGAAAASA